MSNQHIAVPTEIQASLVAWLNYVIGTLAIHKRAEWGAVLEVTPQAIGTWLSGEKLPRPEALRALVSTLLRHYGDRARAALDAWALLSRRPLREVWPGDTRTDAPTLGHYIVIPLWDDLRLAIQSQPPDIQAELLESYVAEANRRRLGERGHLVVSNVPDEQTLREVAPFATRENPQLISRMKRGVQNKRLLDFAA